MTDIIERLRAAIPTYEGTPIAWPCEVRSELLLEAAAEADQLTRERDAARAEVERLRAEMRKIEYLDRPQVRGLPRRVTIQQIALDALAGGKDD